MSAREWRKHLTLYSKKTEKEEKIRHPMNHESENLVMRDRHTQTN